MLHEAGDENVVALIALGPIDPRGVPGNVQPTLNGKGVGGQHLLDDLDVGAVLEDPAVLVQRGKPQPGTQRQAIDEVPPFGTQVAGTIDDAAAKANELGSIE